jgi:hypothetical protein
MEAGMTTVVDCLAGLQRALEGHAAVRLAEMSILF